LIWPQKGAKSTKIKFQGLLLQSVTLNKNRNSNLLPEFCTQKPSVKFGIELPQLTGRGDWSSKIQANPLPSGLLPVLVFRCFTRLVMFGIQ
jgi:hypothetical protein